MKGTAIAVSVLALVLTAGMAGCSGCSANSASSQRSTVVVTTAQTPGAWGTRPTDRVSPPANAPATPLNSAPMPLSSGSKGGYAGPTVELPAVQGYTKVEEREDGPFKVGAYKAAADDGLFELYVAQKLLSVEQLVKSFAPDAQPIRQGKYICGKNDTYRACAIEPAGRQAYGVASKNMKLEQLPSIMDQLAPSLGS